MVSICRESSARARVAEIVRDWLKDASLAVPTPISASSGTLFIASLITCGILLFAVRAVCFDDALLPPIEPHDAAIKAARRQTETKRFFSFHNSLQIF
jgi:hypothetical protein